VRSDGNCSSCGAPIRWARSLSTQRLMPLDAASNPNGNLGVVGWVDTAQVGWPMPVVAVNPTKPVTEYRYMSHFVTCPNADQHRRQR
jgi:hypothetical protein